VHDDVYVYVLLYTRWDDTGWIRCSAMMIVASLHIAWLRTYDNHLLLSTLMT
jgi:hypothetical protein